MPSSGRPGELLAFAGIDAAYVAAAAQKLAAALSASASG